MRQSLIEQELERRHGDLHEVIPRLATEHGQTRAARALSSDDLQVRQPWVSWWLARYGYTTRTVYYQPSLSEFIFRSGYCEFADEPTTTIRDLYEHYMAWCSANGRRSAGGLAPFYREMGRLNIKNRNGKVYLALRGKAEVG